MIFSARALAIVDSQSWRVDAEYLSKINKNFINNFLLHTKNTKSSASLNGALDFGFLVVDGSANGNRGLKSVLVFGDNVVVSSLVLFSVEGSKVVKTSVVGSVEVAA